MLHVTFQTTNGQAAPSGQPDQLHIGPLAYVQFYGDGIEVEVEHGAGNERVVSKGGILGAGYHVQTITSRGFPALRPFDGWSFGSVIIHDGTAPCFDRERAKRVGEPIVDLRNG